MTSGVIVSFIVLTAVWLVLGYGFIHGQILSQCLSGISPFVYGLEDSTHALLCEPHTSHCHAHAAAAC